MATTFKDLWIKSLRSQSRLKTIPKKLVMVKVKEKFSWGNTKPKYRTIMKLLPQLTKPTH